MTLEEAIIVLEKQLDKSCRNYRYQNAEKLDFEDAVWIALSALRAQQTVEKQECYIVVCQNYAEGNDAYAFRTKEKAEASIRQDAETVIAELNRQGYSPRSLRTELGDVSVYVPDTDIYYDWYCVPSHVE